MKRAAALVCAVLFLALQKGDAPLRLTVEGGHFFAAPASFRLRVRIEPDKQNRRLVLELDSDAYYTRHDEDLQPMPDGTLPAATRWVVFRDLPSGDYAISAMVYRADGTHWRASERFQVIGPE